MTETPFSGYLPCGCINVQDEQRRCAQHSAPPPAAAPGTVDGSTTATNEVLNVLRAYRLCHSVDGFLCEVVNTPTGPNTGTLQDFRCALCIIADAVLVGTGTADGSAPEPSQREREAAIETAKAWAKTEQLSAALTALRGALQPAYEILTALDMAVEWEIAPIMADIRKLLPQISAALSETKP